nr:rhomboid family intramembrane serine protease [uncultured Butyrivibrio sp.]
MDTALVVGNSEYYRLFSSMFMHWDINHLFNNMMVLLLVGAVIEHYLGHLAYLFLYIIAGLSGNLMSMYYEIIKSNYRISLGASGATMGIVGFLVVWLVINRKSLAKDKSMLLRLVLLLMFVVEACFFQAQANTQAHLGGFLAGFIMGMINIIMFNNRKDMEGIV